MPIIGIELVGKDATYAWDIERGAQGFRRVTLFDSDGNNLRGSQVQSAIWTALDRERPVLVATPGWSFRGALASLGWCVSNSVPAVVMSESQHHDHIRYPVIENIKRRVLALCSAALVGGSTHVNYAAELGLARERIFTGYDVVDNEHFQSGAERAREDSMLRERMGLPKRYFLASCRFVRQKNLPRLLQAYNRYRLSSPDPWNLVLLGDGPLRADVERSVRRLGMEKHVLAPGFMQYGSLPAYYGLASAFILPSVIEPWGLVVNEALAAGLPVLVSDRCGCAGDLVEEGQNGFTFDPFNTEQLANVMLRLASMPADQRSSMGRASQKIISRWTPEFFAENLEKALEAALAAPRPAISALDRALLWTLIHR